MRSRVDYVAWLRARAAAYRAQANLYASRQGYIKANANTLGEADIYDLDIYNQLFWQQLDMAAALEEAAAALEERRAPDDIGKAYEGGGPGSLLSALEVRGGA